MLPLHITPPALATNNETFPKFISKSKIAYPIVIISSSFIRVVADCMTGWLRFLPNCCPYGPSLESNRNISRFNLIYFPSRKCLAIPRYFSLSDSSIFASPNQMHLPIAFLTHNLPHFQVQWLKFAFSLAGEEDGARAAKAVMVECWSVFVVSMVSIRFMDANRVKHRKRHFMEITFLQTRRRQNPDK